jgi:hypothetical protein
LQSNGIIYDRKKFLDIGPGRYLNWADMGFVFDGWAFKFWRQNCRPRLLVGASTNSRKQFGEEQF